jgi:formate dehydrogenase maturation protein FdhE
MTQHHDLQPYLALTQRLLQALVALDQTPTKGAVDDWEARHPLSDLEAQALDTKTPMIRFLDDTLFDLDALYPVFKRAAPVLSALHSNAKGVERLTRHLVDHSVDYQTLLSAALRVDESVLTAYAEKFDLPPSRLYVAITTPLQPFVEELARRASPSFYDRWWQGNCPICGRTPIVARIRDRKRYLMCAHCGAEYLSDYILCAHCGNKDPYTLNYLELKGNDAFRIDFCTKCQQYLKVIVEGGLTTPIPRFVEDLLTLHLDVVAKDAGLTRFTDAP